MNRKKIVNNSSLPLGVRLDYVESPFYFNFGKPPLFACMFRLSSFTLFGRNLLVTLSSGITKRSVDLPQVVYPSRYILRCFRVYHDLNQNQQISHQFLEDTIIQIGTKNISPLKDDLFLLLDITSHVSKGINQLTIEHKSLAHLFFVIEEMKLDSVDEAVRRISSNVSLTFITHLLSPFMFTYHTPNNFLKFLIFLDNSIYRGKKANNTIF
jgi:hypothetical protein